MQKEQLSALMDGELVDKEQISALVRDEQLQQQWFRYHLIRDSLRGDVPAQLNIDIAQNVMAALENEPGMVSDNAENVHVFGKEKQPEPKQWHKMPFWGKIKPFFTQIGQVGVAAGVSLAVIVGVQQYNAKQDVPADIPSFSTFSVGSLASPVSYGAAPAVSEQQNDMQDSRRHFAILQSYELQRRLYATQQKAVENHQQEIQRVENQ